MDKSDALHRVMDKLDEINKLKNRIAGLQAEVFNAQEGWKVALDQRDELLRVIRLIGNVKMSDILNKSEKIINVFHESDDDFYYETLERKGRT